MIQPFEALDRITESALSVALEPAFSEEVDRRANRKPAVPATDGDCVREFATLIAFSQNARSDLVAGMIEKGSLRIAFGDFDVSHVAALNAQSILEAHWERIRCIRFRKKVKAIIGAAQAMEHLHRSGFDLRKHLRAYPARIQRSADITDFWHSFDSLRGQFRAAKMPYFNQLTSLLHLLLHFGFDCLKPDLIVQNAAIETGLLPPKPGERDLRQLVQTIQEYSLSRGTRPGVVDFYLLVYGGQTWAMQFVTGRASRIKKGRPNK